MDLLRRMNCVIEYGEFGAIRMIALGVPPSMRRDEVLAIRNQLDSLEQQGHLSYTELVVN